MYAIRNMILSKKTTALILSLLGAVLIIVGLGLWIYNSLGIALSAGGGGPLFLLLSGAPLILLGYLCLIAVPILLRRRWPLIILLALPLVVFMWLYLSSI